MSKKPNNDSYRQAGVDIDAGHALVEAIKPLAAATKRPGAGADLGGFGGLFDLKAAGFSDPVLVAANDGVGTKLKLAFATGIHDTIGIDLVAMCVNDLVVQGAEPLFFLDYLASAKLDVAQATKVVAGIAEGCKQAGCALIGGETAEMPGFYQRNEYDLAGFAVGAVERAQLLPKMDAIRAGDRLIGLDSSGLHSNGFSLVRKLIGDHGLSLDAPAPFDPTKTLGKTLLTPTRIYVKSILQAIKQTGAIKAMAHITGGGLLENIPRILPSRLTMRLDENARALPPLFDWLQKLGDLCEEEMLRTFNCGIGMVVVTSVEDAAAVMAALGEAGESVSMIGELVAKE